MIEDYRLRDERKVATHLDFMVGLEYAYRDYDDDGNGVNDYWTGDVTELVKLRVLPHESIHLILQADSAPLEFAEEDPTPFHGYYFRILTRQGEHASGGAHSYIINDNMVAGYALIAYPAVYDRTGIMTFVVSKEGTVYEKDLGEATTEIVKYIDEYNPDETWTESE